jgi:hypothetical protein
MKRQLPKRCEFGQGGFLEVVDPKIKCEVPGIPWAYLDDPFNDHPALMFFTYRQYLKERERYYRTHEYQLQRARDYRQFRMKKPEHKNNQRSKTLRETATLPWATDTDTSIDG